MTSNPEAIETAVPLVIPTKSMLATARLVMRNDLGQVIQQWLIRQSKSTLGSAPSCTLRCQAPGIAPYHALIVVGAKQIFVRALAPRLSRHTVPVNELILTDEENQFEIAGHLFSLFRRHGNPRDHLDHAEQGSDAQRRERMRFTLARPLEIDRRRAKSNVESPVGYPENVSPIDSKWVAQMVQQAIEPLECQLQNVLAPLAELQQETQKQRTLHETLLEQAAERQHSQSHDSALTNLPGRFDELAENQTAALGTLSGRIESISQHLVAIEQLLKQDLDAEELTQLSQQDAIQTTAIEQLQAGMISLTSALQDLEQRHTSSREEDSSWRTDISAEINHLRQAVEDLAIKADQPLSAASLEAGLGVWTADLQRQLGELEQRIREEFSAAYQNSTSQLRDQDQLADESQHSDENRLSDEKERRDEKELTDEERGGPPHATESDANPTEVDHVPEQAPEPRLDGNDEQTEGALGTFLDVPESGASAELEGERIAKDDWDGDDDEQLSFRDASTDIAEESVVDTEPWADSAEGDTGLGNETRADDDQESEFIGFGVEQSVEQHSGSEARPSFEPGTAVDDECEQLETEAQLVQEPEENLLPSWWTDEDEADPAADLAGSPSDTESPAIPLREEHATPDGSLVDGETAEEELPIEEPSLADESSETDESVPVGDASSAELAPLDGDLLEGSADTNRNECESELSFPTESVEAALDEVGSEPNGFAQNASEVGSESGEWAEDSPATALDATAKTAPRPFETAFSEDESSSPPDSDSPLGDGQFAEADVTRPVNLFEGFTDVENREGQEEEETSEQLVINGAYLSPQASGGASEGEAGQEEVTIAEECQPAVQQEDPALETVDTNENSQGAEQSNEPELSAETELSRSILAEENAEDSEQCVESEAEQAEVHDDHHDSDSVDDYMRKLLARMRGVPEEEVEEVAQPVKRLTVSHTQPHDHSAQVANETSDTTQQAIREATPAAGQATDPLSPDTYLPRMVVPEQDKHLTAFRDLANSSARTAIEQSARRRQATNVALKACISVVGLIVGVVLIALNGLQLNIGLIATVAAFLVAAIWGYDAISSLRPLIESKFILKPRAAEEQDDAAEE